MMSISCGLVIYLIIVSFTTLLIRLLWETNSRAAVSYITLGFE